MSEIIVRQESENAWFSRVSAPAISGRRLRAGVGDRLRADADPRGCRRVIRLHPRPGDGAARRRGAGGAHLSTAA
jgi:hypothetical protein